MSQKFQGIIISTLQVYFKQDEKIEDIFEVQNAFIIYFTQFATNLYNYLVPVTKEPTTVPSLYVSSFIYLFKASGSTNESFQ